MKMHDAYGIELSVGDRVVIFSYNLRKAISGEEQYRTNSPRYGEIVLIHDDGALIEIDGLKGPKGPFKGDFLKKSHT